MNYVPVVVAGTSSTNISGKKDVETSVESKTPTVSSTVPTVCLDNSSESSSGPRLITKGDFRQKETPSLRNALTLSNMFEDTFGMEADLSNMETSIPMDVKSAFLYSTIDEEVYVMQPPGFQDPEFPDRLYKVEKAMYGLHQAPRAWYGTLSKYLLDNGFQRDTIDQTLFIKKHKREFLLV
nr:putative ribonuclease H-like domain-containing protein [Tanacetum cinerariifolium]